MLSGVRELVGGLSGWECWDSESRWTHRNGGRKAEKAQQVSRVTVFRDLDLYQPV